MRIDVGPLELAVDLLLPGSFAAHTRLLVCLPGGGVTRRYFDMGDAGDDRFSFARAMTAAGHAVALIDPPGVGDSGTIADPYELTVAAQLPLLAKAVTAIREQPGLSEIPVVGVGHSAGAMFTAALQAHYRCYVALVMLCFGGRGLPQHMSPEWLAAVSADPLAARERIPEFARAQYKRATFHTRFREARGDGSLALQSVLTPTLAAIALQAMTPGNVAPELAAIDVPLFTAVGDRDMVGPPHLLGEAFAACPDYTRIVVANAGHHIFLSENAPALFARLDGWLAGLQEKHT